MAGASVRAATEKLRKQATGDYGLGKSYEAPSPAAAMYGVFGPQYAAALAAPTPSAGEQALREMALRNNAEEEARRYEEQLLAAQANQLQGEHIRGGYGLREALIGQMPEGALHGQYDVGQNPDGSYGVFQDPILQAAANDININASVADTRQKNAAAIGSLADAGIRTPVETAAGYMTHPLQETPDTFGVWNPQQFTPTQETEEYKADEGKTFEQQKELALIEANARIAAARANGDEIKVVVDRVEGGAPVVRYEGTPEVLRRNGIDPTTGKPINPNAGAQGGGAPATPAANSNNRADRNNNPGNIKDGPWAKSQPGYAGSDGTFAKFNSIEAGYGAATRLLSNNYINKGFDTPRKIVERWAPGSENSKASRDNYAQYVADKLGITPDTKITQQHAPFIAKAIHEFESGNRVAPRVKTSQGNPSRVNNLQVIAARAQRVPGAKVQWDNGTLIVTSPSGKQLRYAP